MLSKTVYCPQEHRERKRQKIGEGASASPPEVQPQAAEAVKEDHSASQAPGYQAAPMMQSGVAPGMLGQVQLV